MFNLMNDSKIMVNGKMVNWVGLSDDVKFDEFEWDDGWKAAMSHFRSTKNEKSRYCLTCIGNLEGVLDFHRKDGVIVAQDQLGRIHLIEDE